MASRDLLLIWGHLQNGGTGPSALGILTSAIVHTATSLSAQRADLLPLVSALSRHSGSAGLWPPHGLLDLS